MSSVISDERKIIFIHIPKTGGTSIEKVLLAIPEFRVLKDSMLQRRSMWLGLQKWNPDIWDKIKTYTVFCIVRQPEDRFLSAYNDFFHTRVKKTYIDLPLTVSESLINISECKKSYIGFYAHGLVTMVKHLPNLGYINHILKYENLKEELKNLFNLLDLPFPNILPYMRQSNKKITSLSEKQKKLIYMRFEEDYDAFGYKVRK